jgi:acetate---CoA ligase (ADP-forming)
MPLTKFFAPKSVAVVGASRQPEKVGYTVVHNLVHGGFAGKIYPVNPQAGDILGMTSYKSLLDIPGSVDLAVIVIPAKFVLQTIKECAAKKVPAVIIITAGFKEAGKDGAQLEKQMLQLAQENGIRIVGPNCLGLINTHAHLNASFSAGMPNEGNLAVISQSGAFGTAILDWAYGAEVGFSKFVSFGNKSDVDEAAIIDSLEKDDLTDVILAYLESVKDGARFMKAAGRVSRVKPIVIMKVGTTAAGAKAASSHTGALAGSETALDSAFRKSGVFRTQTCEEFFDYAIAFGSRRTVQGRNVVIVTNAGGPGVISTDAIERSRLKMAELSPATVEGLKKVLPAAANCNNPVDVLGDAQPDRYEAALKLVGADPNVHAAIVLITPQSVTDVPATAKVIAQAAASMNKPVLACLMGGKNMVEGTRLLMKSSVPTYPFPERAVAALNAMYTYHVHRTSTPPVSKKFDVKRDAVKRIIDTAIARDQLELGELEARDVISAYGFRVPQCIEAATEAEASEAARKLGFPVVLKISSPDILHKSDVGGVKVGMQDEAAVRKAFREIMASVKVRKPEAQVRGVLVQEMVRGGKEVILGVNRDPLFGPLLMLGLGGIYVEVLKDVVFQLAPISEEEAREMVASLKSYKLLQGVRGEKPADVQAVVEGICRISQLVGDFPQIAEMDVNPLSVYAEGKGAVAIDARLRLTRI